MSQGKAFENKLVDMERSFRGVIEKLTQALAQHKKETDGSFSKVDSDLEKIRDLIADEKTKSMDKLTRSLEEFEGRIKKIETQPSTGSKIPDPNQLSSILVGDVKA